jgi:hypothetical protein
VKFLFLTVSLLACAAPMPETACATGTRRPAISRISPLTGSKTAAQPAISSGATTAMMAAGIQRAK